MSRRRVTPIIVSYVLSLGTTIALLVAWVTYFVGSSARLQALAERAGVSQRNSWIILWGGCILFFLLIVGLTYQLAQSIAAQRYTLKQDDFLSNVTHELKSPLAAIKLHAQTLQQQGVAATDRERSVGFIVQQVERMETLVENILTSSRLIARKERLELEPVALAPFFDRYFEEVRERVERQGVRLATRVDSSSRVMASTDALHRVMDNLLDNAVRFSERGGEVRCEVSDLGRQVRIEVEDDGIGIPKGELKKIFDRFYQIGKEISGRRRGTGLGLSIVSGLVEQMKGSIRALSPEGRSGTRFVVELPRLEERV